MRPTGSRNVLDKIANAIIHDVGERGSLPPSFAPSGLSEIVIVSDFWNPIAEIRKTLAQLASSGAHGHVVQVVDPAEETFPYSGRVEFVEPEGAGSITAAAPKPGNPNTSSASRNIAPNCAPSATSMAGASPSTAPTASYRDDVGTACPHERAAAWRRQRRARQRAIGREVRMMGLPLGFAQPLVLLGLLSLPVLWWLLRMIPPAAAADRLPAGAAVVRHQA